MEMPDFHIPHAEKIEWMIENQGWAIEPVPARPDTDPPVPGYAFTMGVPALTGFPELAVFGLTPVAAKGLLGLVIDNCRAGIEIPIGVELVGLLENDMRCAFAPIDAETSEAFFTTAVSWYKGGGFDIVQLVYPDPQGVMPYEAGFDERLRLSQPIVGTFTG